MQENFKITYQTTIHADVETVWEGLTNPAIVKRYFFGSNQETDWKVGSPIQWKGEFEGNTYLDKGIVLDFRPHQGLSYSYLASWSGLADEPENYLRISYTVAPTAKGTVLTITQSNYDEERAVHSEKNWAMVIDGLKKIVEK